MNIGKLFQKWCNAAADSQAVIITDSNQISISEEIKNDWGINCEIRYFSIDNELFSILKLLRPKDLLIILISIDTYVKAGANNYFSPFIKPDWIESKYAFVRLDISKESLLQGLSTEKKLVYSKIDEMSCFTSGQFLWVSNEAGTDISFKINPFSTCPHEIKEDGGFAFLPPSETSAEVITETANGRIVVDMTIGQLYYFGNLLNEFGLVESPVTIIVENGIITDVYGNVMAMELKAALFDLSVECRMLTELGQGLSRMAPTGLIGVDESIIDSCHFGFGDGGACGVHLDVVISNPLIIINNEGIK